MEIKEYEPKYLSSMFNINQACHSKPQPNVGLLEQIHKGQTWVALENDKVIGFLLSTWREGPYIYNVAVSQEHRNKVIATQLFKVCHEFYREQGYTYLYVDINNPAQKLYFNLGYRVKDIERGFYGKNQDALIMVRTISIV